MDWVGFWQSGRVTGAERSDAQRTRGVDSVDFFVSYTGADARWAEWIAWVLEDAGYRALIQAWDFGAGSHFVSEMHRAARDAVRTVAVLSSAYLESAFAEAEWQAAWGADPSGRDRKLLAFRIEDCARPGLLGQLVTVDLFGLDRGTARLRLLAAARNERGKPPAEPVFPGGTIPPVPRTTKTEPVFPGMSLSAGGSGTPSPGAAARRTAPRDAVTVLHLPEVRAGRAGRSGTQTDMDWLAESLAADVDQLATVHGCLPDLLVVTGNVAEHGRASEYGQAVRLFDGLLSRWGLPKHRFVVVPGSRDVNQAACRAYFDGCEADEVEPVPPYWPKWRHFERMLTAFYGTAMTATFAVGQEWSLFPVDDLKIVVAGLNSTIGVSHRDGERQGLAGAAQIRWFVDQLAEYERRGWLRVGAVHHGLDMPGSASDEDEVLADSAAVLRDVGPRLSLLLPGRSGGATGAGPPASPDGLLSLPAASGTAGALASYQLVRIDRHGVSRWGRTLRAGGHDWADSAIDRTSGYGSAGTSRRDRLGRVWAAADATFPERAPDGEAVDPRGRRPGHGHDPDGETADLRGRRSGPDPDRFIARVAEVARLRHAGQPGDASVLEIGPTMAGPGYLRVTCRDGAMVTQHPVGVLEHDPDVAAVEVFARHVHRGYAATDPQLVSDLVYGGEPPGRDLVDTAWRQGVRLISFVAYQGLMDLREYVAAQTVRLERDPLYPPPLYLPQRFRGLDGRDSGDSREERAGEDALEQVVRWLAADEARFVLLLGDFGRGKTWSGPGELDPYVATIRAEPPSLSGSGR